MKCPSCGAASQNGKYCAECGAALDVRCASCEAAVPPGARFCTACGEPVRASARGGGRAAWVIGAAAALVVVLLLFLPRQTERVPVPAAGGAEAPFSGPGGTGGTGGQGGTGGDGAAGAMPDLSPDMRTNAERLFNRIMMAAERGDQAEVQRFMPMAIQAYDMVEDLDEDGLYHLAILHLTAGDPAAARRTAQRILDGSPNHILALGVAASAAEMAGDSTAAEAVWSRLLDAYPEESARRLQEYVDHRTMLTQYERAARDAIGRE